MPVKINWYNNTQGLEGQNIYRTEGKLDIVNPGTPLATVGAGVFTYTDETAIQGRYYNYAIGGVKGSDISLSDPIPVLYTSDTGPGPQSIVRGDWDFGYFGRLPIGDLIDATTLRDQLGITATIVTAAGTAATVWHKFAWKGKIVFFPDQYLWSTCAWKTLYDIGAVFGTAEVPAHIKTAFGTVAQNRVVSTGGRNYVFRLPTARDNPTNYAGRVGGDVDQFMSSARLLKNYTLAKSYGMDDLNAGTGNTGFLTQDTDSAGGTNIVTRGAGAGGYMDAATVVLGPTTTTGNYCHTKPILELIL